MSDKSFTNSGTIANKTIASGGAMNFALTMKCNVKRRNPNASKNALNEIDYGKVKDWDNVYINIPCRLEIQSSPIQFKPTGERVAPMNILYVNASTPLKVEDRVFIGNTDAVGLNIVQEFIVQGTKPALSMVGLPTDHLEYDLLIP
jgi:hypothetical protein